MIKDFELWKRTVVTGCEFEDGRKTSIKFFLVNQEDEDDFGESLADDYGYTDYSYQPDYTKIAELNTNEVLKLAEVFEIFKQDYENKQMLIKQDYENKKMLREIENGNE